MNCLEPELKSAVVPQNACLIASAATDWLHFLDVRRKTCVYVGAGIRIPEQRAVFSSCVCVIAEDRRELKEVLTLEIIEELEGVVRVTGTAIP